MFDHRHRSSRTRTDHSARELSAPVTGPSRPAREIAIGAHRCDSYCGPNCAGR